MLAPRPLARCVATVAILLLPASCGTGRFLVKMAPAQPLASYGTVVVDTFDVAAGAQLDDEGKALAAGAALQIKGLLLPRFPAPAVGARQLRLRGSVTELDPGSRTARFFLGLGVGKGHIALDVSFVDDRGAVVARGRALGTVSGGTWGGELEDAYERAADAVVRFCRDHGR